MVSLLSGKGVNRRLEEEFAICMTPSAGCENASIARGPTALVLSRNIRKAILQNAKEHGDRFWWGSVSPNHHPLKNRTVR